MDPRDVVISGIGMVTPLGATARASALAWREGRAASRRTVPELAGTPLAGAEVAALPPLDAAERLGGRRLLKYLSAAGILGCVAAREAAAAARIAERFAPERRGLFAATGLAAASLRDVEPMVARSIGTDGRFSIRLFGERGLPQTNPLLSFKILANMAACIVSIQESIKGANCIFTPWEGQAGAALLEAWLAVRDGEVDCALAGAADDATQPMTVVTARRDGHLGEGELASAGAAYLVLERAETARRDGITACAVLVAPGLAACDDAPVDPLAGRLGRTFAAAPAILVGLACFELARPTSVCLVGADGHRFTAEVRPIP